MLNSTFYVFNVIFIKFIFIKNLVYLFIFIYIIVIIVVIVLIFIYLIVKLFA